MSPRQPFVAFLKGKSYYCPRLYYLEEVEELYTQDAAVFAGRRLHAELEKKEDEDWEDLFLVSEELGLRGRVDALRTRDGQTIPYEHKRGRCHRATKNLLKSAQPYSNLINKITDISWLPCGILYIQIPKPSTSNPHGSKGWADLSNFSLGDENKQPQWLSFPRGCL